MLKIFQKKSKFEQILNKKFTNVSELHEKLSQMGITWDITTTYTLGNWYLLHIDGHNRACRLYVERDCVWLARG